MRIKKLTICALIAAGTCHLSYAAGEGAYIGLIAGASNAHNKTENVQTGVSQVAPTTNPDPTASTPPAAVPVAPSNSGMAGGFIIGYAFNQYGAFELGYTHYASSSYSKPNGSQLTHDSTINLNTIDLAMKGSIPFQAVNIFGKIGILQAYQGFSGSLEPVTVQPSGKVVAAGNNLAVTAVRPMFGFGVSYDITQNWVVDVTYTTFTGGGGVQGADLLALEMSYHFVDLMCGQFLC
ncbi:MAG: outer membrane beta-barrel protein [Gammaproteobacteria bacterium]|nr:outer membrane beta-barrel protein [Gammaproteobacteria bacterium]